MVLVGTASYGDVAEEAEASENDAPQPTVLPGMETDEVRALLGDPTDIFANDARTRQKWVWRMGGRQLVVHFVDGKVERVVEQMPWGEETILAQ